MVMKKLKMIPIRTIQISVDNDLYQRLKQKKGNRNWYAFMYDIAEE